MADSGDNGKGEVYFEITIVGGSAKVVAVDARTGIEVTAIGPARASRADLHRLALAKLKARLARGGD
ncbi:MAG: serine hydroxymethyltransferase [Rhodopseudomonas sp.]|nr:serine hydroxymethyltransferase [Rhodopseudomonas sp.]